MRNSTLRARRTARFLIALSTSLTALSAAAFTVSTTNDSGAGSLRQAILDANAASVSCATQSIDFAIPGTGVKTIRPTSALPDITTPITLNGYSQTGAQQNTQYDGDNAVLTIELDGSLAGSSNGLTLRPVKAGTCGANGSIIEGLVIDRFALAGVEMSSMPCTGNQCYPVGAYVIGSFIGTDPTGSVAKGNGIGLHFGFNSDASVVGEKVLFGNTQTPAPGLRNIISGNLSDGVRMDSTDITMPSQEHSIRGNYIGVDATGTHALGNGRYGIFGDAGSTTDQIEDNIIAAHPADGVRIMDGTTIRVASNAIGAGVNGAALGNGGDGIHVGTGVIGVTVTYGYPSLSSQGIASVANNTGAGLYVEGATTTVDVSAGSFGDNGGLGIDLAPRGPNANDTGDADTGPNELVNAPVLTSAVITDGASPPTTVSGTLDTNASSSNGVDFYISASCDPSGYGEGGAYVGSANNLTADASGHVAFSKAVYASQGMAVTALTRRFSDTPPPQTTIVSEFSNCIVVGDPIFSNGFDQ